MAFKNSLKLYLEKDFSPSWAAASLLAHDRSRPSQPPAAPRASPRLGPAQRRAGLPPRACPLTRRAAPRTRPRQSVPAAWRPCAVDAAARRSRPAPVPTRPPTPAGAGALAHSLPRCLSSPPEPRAPSSASRRATAPAGEIRRGQ